MSGFLSCLAAGTRNTSLHDSVRHFALMKFNFVEAGVFDLQDLRNVSQFLKYNDDFCRCLGLSSFSNCSYGGLWYIDLL